jgi:hypothetical protein
MEHSHITNIIKQKVDGLSVSYHEKYMTTVIIMKQNILDAS